MADSDIIRQLIAQIRASGQSPSTVIAALNRAYPQADQPQQPDWTDRVMRQFQRIPPNPQGAGDFPNAVKDGMASHDLLTGADRREVINPDVVPAPVSIVQPAAFVPGATVRRDITQQGTKDNEDLWRGWDEFLRFNKPGDMNADKNMQTKAPTITDPAEISTGKYSGLGQRTMYPDDPTNVSAQTSQPLPMPPPDPGAQLWQQTVKQFPALKNYPIDFAFTPKEGGDMLESYPPEEEDRPSYLPKGRFGVEVFNPDTSPMDVLGDVISHYGVYHDPKVQALYKQFQDNIPPEGQAALKDLYREAQGDDEEKRPYAEWLKMSGMPAYLRGRLVNQFKDTDYPGAYSPQQMQAIQQMQQYYGIPGAAPAEPAAPSSVASPISVTPVQGVTLGVPVAPRSPLQGAVRPKSPTDQTQP
jgi:hypothetical protein